MKKVKLIDVLAVMLLLTAEAFAEDQYAFILRARGNPYWNAVKQGIEESARVQSISTAIYQGESEVGSEEQLNLCLAAIERRPKFLAIAAVNSNLGIQCLKRAAEKGILVGDIDRQIPIEEAEKQGVKLAFSVGSDNLVIGRIAANYGATIVHSKQPKIFILEGATGAIAGKQRVEGFREVLRSILPEAIIVASISGDWDRLKAMNSTTDVLSRTPSLDLIYAANDMMAIGAIEALRAQNRSKQVQVIGVDGTADARRAVSNGEMAATVAQLPYLIGKRVVELGIRVVKGEPVAQLERIETPILSREALENTKAPYAEYLR